MTQLDLIPADRRDLAAAALREAFGAAPVTVAAPVTGGASGALAFRIESGGRSFVMRMETARDAFRDSRRGFAAMRAAADAGIAPAVRHADPETGVAIMDFIATQPLTAFPGGPAALAEAAGDLIARVHATPPFPPLADFRLVLDRLVGAIARPGLFAPGLLTPHLDAYERLKGAYPWGEEEPVSSHNDPNGRNILYDGQRLWLIDWETAYRNDPMVDAAILVGDFAPTPELGDIMLAAAFRRAPDARLRARLRVMYLLTRLYYAGLLFTMAGAANGDAPEPDLDAPSPEAFQAAVMRGEFVVGDPRTAFVLGKIILERFMARFADLGLDEVTSVLDAG